MNKEFIFLPNVEIELRLGTFNNKKFDSSIDKNYFLKILHELEYFVSNNNNNVTVEIIKTIEYIKNDSNNKNIKLIINESTNPNTENLIVKENIITTTTVLDNSPFDVRFSVNQEILLNSEIHNFNKNTQNIVIRNKLRKSFIFSDYKYDLTSVVETINNLNKEKFEIEIELIINNNTILWDENYIYDFLKCKIYDIIKIIESDSFEFNKLSLNLKNT